MREEGTLIFYREILNTWGGEGWFDSFYRGNLKGFLPLLGYGEQISI
jgi:hypothetical protein